MATEDSGVLLDADTVMQISRVLAFVLEGGGKPSVEVVSAAKAVGRWAVAAHKRTAAAAVPADDMVIQHSLRLSEDRTRGYAATLVLLQQTDDMQYEAIGLTTSTELAERHLAGDETVWSAAEGLLRILTLSE